MKRVIAELPYEKMESCLHWATQAVLWVHRGREEERPGIAIRLFHGCGAGDTYWKYCVRQNNAAAKPQYVCNSCSTQAPLHVIEEKLLAAREYAGYDPRNNRKAAVLATKNKREHK
jgi:hypothetical protein